jgi:hypothetical protein
MRRRDFLKTAVVAGAAVFGTGHTPYGQWSAYRQQYLLILTNRADESYSLGKRVVEVLATYLPESKARVARAPHLRRVASLIGTKQLDVALLRRVDAEALLRGEGPFAKVGPVPLRSIVVLGDYLLLCRDDFPDDHAYVIAETLSRYRDLLPVPVAVEGAGAEGTSGSVTVHPGALAFRKGSPPPAGAFAEPHSH